MTNLSEQPRIGHNPKLLQQGSLWNEILQVPTVAVRDPNVMPQNEINMQKEGFLADFITRNVADLIIPMSEMSKQWQIAYSAQHLYNCGFGLFAQKFIKAFGEVPALDTYEDTLPSSNSPNYKFAQAANLITPRLPNALQNALKYSTICQRLDRRTVLPHLPHQVLNPDLWYQYMPELINAPPEQIQEVVEQTIVNCFSGTVNFVEYTRDVVKILKHRSTYMTGESTSPVTVEEGKFITRVQDTFERMNLEPQHYLQGHSLEEARIERDIPVAILRWLSYMVAQTKSESLIPKNEMKDIEIHAQNQLIQVFYDLHQSHGYTEDQVKGAFHFFVQDLGMLKIGEAMRLPKNVLLQQLGGIYAPIEAYFSMRNKLPFLKDVSNSYIRSAVSEDDQDIAAQEDRKGIDMVIEYKGAISAVCQVKGSYQATDVQFAKVPEKPTGIDILDKRLYPAETTQQDREQCMHFIKQANITDETLTPFVKLMKYYHNLVSQVYTKDRDVNQRLIKAIYSADKLRKEAKNKKKKVGQDKDITPLFIIAPSRIPS